MRSALVTAGLILAVVSTATPAAAQFRGRLISRPPVPSAGPRSPGSERIGPVLPLRPLSIWSPWFVAWVPEGVALEQGQVAEGAPAGGVQLDIQPWSADVYVDGARVGRVEQFRGYYQHLELPAGPHTIAIVASGYQMVILDVLVIPGKTITYRTTLQR